MKEHLPESPTFFLRRSESRFVIVSTVAALLLRYFVVGTQSVINSDGIYYATLGKKLITGDFAGGVSAYWAPFYPFLIGVSSLFFDDVEFAARMVSVIAGALLIAPAYMLAREFYGRPAAVLTSILLIIHPSLVRSSVWAMTEAVYTLLFVVILLLGWRAVSTGGPKYFFVTGLFVGLAYLTKPEAIGFVGLVIVLSFGTQHLLNTVSLRSQGAGILLLVMGFSVFFVPYFAYVYQKTGHWTVSQKVWSNVAVGGEKGLLELTADGSTTMRDRLFSDGYETNAQPGAPAAEPPRTQRAPKTIGSKISELTTRALPNLKKQLFDHLRRILPLAFLLLILCGLLLTKWTRAVAAREVYLFSFVACTILGYAVAVIEVRYSFPLIPIFMSWTARGIVEVTGRLENRRSSARGKRDGFLAVGLNGLILVALVTFLVPAMLSQFEAAELTNVPLEEKDAGHWIKQYGETTTSRTVMSSSPTVAFYADANHIYVPNERFPKVLEYAKRKNVDFLVFGQRRARNTPNAFPEAERSEPGLSLIYKDERYPNFRVLIWQLTDR